MFPLTPHDIHTRPSAALVAAIRDHHGLTQLQCAYIVGVTRRAWIGYETKDQAIPLGIWWLFLLRIGEIREPHLPNIPPRQRAGAMVHLKPA